MRGPSCYSPGVRSLLQRLLVLGIVGSMTPGLSEAGENLWHLLRTGHTAHAQAEGSDHAPEGDEHGCTGTFHLCSCHHSSPSTLTVATVAYALPSTEHRSRLRPLKEQSPDLPGLFHPPRA